MVLAGVLGALLTLRVLQTADDTTAVVVAAVDLAPGTVLDDGTLTTAEVSGERAVLAELFAADELADVSGQVVTEAVRGGALVTRGDISTIDAGTAPRAMSFPLDAARAVGGELESGDRVDVVEVDTDANAASYVMTNVEVLAVEGDDEGPLGGGGDELIVTLAVDPESALHLAAALETATVSIVRATGAEAIDLPVVDEEPEP